MFTNHSKRVPTRVTTFSAADNHYREAESVLSNYQKQHANLIRSTWLNTPSWIVSFSEFAQRVSLPWRLQADGPQSAVCTLACDLPIIVSLVRMSSAGLRWMSICAQPTEITILPPCSLSFPGEPRLLVGPFQDRSGPTDPAERGPCELKHIHGRCKTLKGTNKANHMKHTNAAKNAQKRHKNQVTKGSFGMQIKHFFLLLSAVRSCR